MKQPFRMVERGRMDLVIANRFTGEKIIVDLELKKVVPLLPPVQVDPLYHYLHRKHADLVARVTSALKIMQKSGRIDSIKRKFGIL